jgi:hypothetical protein
VPGHKLILGQIDVALKLMYGRPDPTASEKRLELDLGEV